MMINAALTCYVVLQADYGDVEMPWWTYGARGMQLWFPSSLAEPLSPTTREMMGFGSSTDPELEFDREVYPIGISLTEIAIIGVHTHIMPLKSTACSLSWIRL